jgi:hypothetical protein
MDDDVRQDAMLVYSTTTAGLFMSSNIVTNVPWSAAAVDNDTSCTELGDSDEFPENYVYVRAAVIIIQTIIFIAGLIGNTLIIHTTLITPVLHSVQNALIVNLSIANLSATLLVTQLACVSALAHPTPFHSGISISL